MKIFGLDLVKDLSRLNPRLQLIFIGLVSGTVSGFAAFLLTYGLDFFSFPLSHGLPSWIRPFVPGLGIVLTVVVLKSLIKDFGGHGVPEVIASVGASRGRLRFRSSYSQLVGSLITISCGGSAGPEAPVVVSGASLGSHISSRLGSSARVRAAVTGSGAAAAIASIFNAPITGIIFTMEVILGEWTAMNLLPVAIASAAGTLISHVMNGNRVPFLHPPYEVGLADILASSGLAILAAATAVLFIRAIGFSRRFLKRVLRRDFVIALGGGVLVSLLVFLFREVRGEGYSLVSEMIGGEFRAGLGMVLVLVLAKIAATGVTLGAGGAGGIFAPSLVIGSLTGLLYHLVLTSLFPGVPFAGAGLFALVGMTGVLSGALQAPLTGIFLVFEITRGYTAIVPLLLVAFLSATLVKLVEKHSIYHRELVEKGLLRRPRTDLRILSDLTIDELLESEIERIGPEMTLKELAPTIARSKRDYFAVEEAGSGRFLGLLLLQDVKPFLFEPHLPATLLVEELFRKDLPVLSRNEGLVEAFKKFEESGAWSLPVVESGRFVGLVSKSSVLDHYRIELMAQTEI